MSVTIIHKKGSGIPAPESLEVAEVAVDVVTGTLYTKTNNGKVIEIGGSGGGDGNGNPVVISDDPPASPEEGDLWYSSKVGDEGLYCWDGEVWFEAGGANGADGENGQDAKQIWSETTPDGDIYYNKSNVGIGAENPSSKLAIDGGTAGNYTDGITLRKSGGNYFGKYPSENNLEFRSVTGNTHIATFAYGGNVGIGIDNPSTELHLASNTGSTVTLQRSGSGDGNGIIKSIGNGGVENSRITLGGGSNNALMFGTGSAGTERLRIAADGNATFSGTVTATSPSNTGVPTSTIQPSLLLMGGNTAAGEGGELGFGAFGTQKFAAIKGSISNASGNGTGNIDFYTRGVANNENMVMALRITKDADAQFSGTVSAPNITRNGAPVIDAKGLINTLSTLRKATKDETTLEGLRDSIGNAIGGLIENLEHEIATMPAPETETGTMEISE